MRDIDDAGDAEDQRQPGRDEEQAGGGGESVERLEEEGVEGHEPALIPPLQGRVPSEQSERGG